VHRLSDLIDVCLADDRLNSTELSLRVEGIDLGRAAHDLCDEIRAFAPGRTLTVEAIGPAPVLGDPALLRVALSNLVDNALKFSPPDTPVLVRIDDDPDLVTLRVIDQGPGISAEDMPRLFEKFFRSTRVDRVRGAGLGLYLVHRIAELHHGGVAVESPPGEGATFALWLPRRRVGE
jgi:signal transduction histidine kinase